MRVKCSKRYLGLREAKLQESGKSCIMLSYMKLYSSPNKIRNLKSRRMRWAEYLARMEQSTNVYRVVVGRPERKTLVKPTCRYKDNIKTDLKEVGCEARKWMDISQDTNRSRAYIRAMINIRVP